MKTYRQSRRSRRAMWLPFVLSLAGCATTADHDPRDPWEGWNRGVQKFNDTLDDYVMKPVAQGYQFVTPSVMDQGVTNFFSNVDDICVIANDLLPGAPPPSSPTPARRDSSCCSSRSPRSPRCCGC